MSRNGNQANRGCIQAVSSLSLADVDPKDRAASRVGVRLLIALTFSAGVPMCYQRLGRRPQLTALLQQSGLLGWSAGLSLCCPAGDLSALLPLPSRSSRVQMGPASPEAELQHKVTTAP